MSTSYVRYPASESITSIPVPVNQGGTGQTTATAAFNALAPSQTSNSGKFLTTNGTTTSWASVSSSFPLLGPNDSAAAPDYSFTNSTGLGIFRKAADSLGFAGAGVEVGSYSSAGIWTIGPSALASSHIINSTGLTFTGNNANTSYSLVRNNATGSVYLAGGPDTQHGGLIQLYGDSHATKANTIEMGTGNVFGFTMDANQNLNLGSANASTGFQFLTDSIFLGRIGAANGLSFLCQNATGFVRYGGGTSGSNGGQVIAYAETHATKPGKVEIISAGTVGLTMDTSQNVVIVGNVSAANLSGTNTGDQTTVSGNAGTATALQTARTINGTSFNGTANITVTAAAGTLTGTTLNSTVVTSSLTSVGTLSSLAVTGAATVNSVGVGSSANTITALTNVASTTTFTVKTNTSTQGLKIDTNQNVDLGSANSTAGFQFFTDNIFLGRTGSGNSLSFLGQNATGFIRYGSGTSGSQGGQMVAYAESHATLPKEIDFVQASTTVGKFRTSDGAFSALGTSTNDSASAGFIGEYIESVISSATNVPGASGAWGNLTSISLTAGDWDVDLNSVYTLNGATAMTFVNAAISVNSGATTTDQVVGSNQTVTFVPTAARGSNAVIASYRLSLSATTTVYAKAQMDYSTATPQYVCRISARRMR